MADLTSLSVVLAIAVLVPILVDFTRIRIAEVVLLIVGGAICGPQMLGLITPSASLTLLSELGMGLLFFLAGMQIDAARLRGRPGRLGAASWLVSVVIAAILSLLLALGDLPVASVGMAIALTTTALGALLPMLRDSGEIDTPFGRFFNAAGEWAEFGPIFAIAILLASKNVLHGIAAIVIFLVVAFVLAVLPRYLRHRRLSTLMHQGYRLSSQLSMRIVMLLVVVLLTLTHSLGLDMVLGAFAAGLIARRYLVFEASSPIHVHTLMPRIEAMAFGFFVPIFFVMTGAGLQLQAIVNSPVRVLLFFGLIILARGVPQVFIYRKDLPRLRDRIRMGAMLSTTLPLLVAITAVEVQSGQMTPNDAAIIVAAGTLTVIVFPALASVIQRSERTSLVA